MNRIPAPSLQLPIIVTRDNATANAIKLQNTVTAHREPRLVQKDPLASEQWSPILICQRQLDLILQLRESLVLQQTMVL
jgi:hypothetical protein